jgi:hypothetical protein
MKNNFSESDKRLLKKMGVSAEPTLAEDRMALAKRIAKHEAPVQVVVDPDRARRQLIYLALQKLLAAQEDRDEIGGTEW